MKWNNLKNNKCPTCGGILIKESSLHFCVGSGCTFRVSAEKFNEIVNSLYKPKELPADNFEALQNLGHEEVTEDFSDSPYADH